MKRLSASQCLQHPFFQCYDILSVYGLKLNTQISNSCLNNFSQNLIDNNNNNNLNTNLQKKNSSTSTSNNVFSNTIEKKKKSNINK